MTRIHPARINVHIWIGWDMFRDFPFFERILSDISRAVYWKVAAPRNSHQSFLCWRSLTVILSSAFGYKRHCD